MPLVKSFEPVIGHNPKVLILGSMPGIASLKAQQYYAHPRNGFWPIMAQLFDVEWPQDYDSRISRIRQFPLVLWDTLKACRREGSLDSAISTEQLEANDIIGLLEKYPSIRLIAFNGAASEKYFKQTLVKLLPPERALKLIRLPSTSPAHASKNIQQKLEEWKIIKQFLD